MALESQAAFSRRINKDRGHVTRLKQAGRLVMEGKKVNVEASLRLLEATDSPLPHHQANTAAQAERRSGQAATQPTSGSSFGANMPTLEKIGTKIKYEQAKKMEAEAEMARMERDRLKGRLVEIDDVKRAGSDLGVMVRTAVESAAHRIAPELVPITETSAMQTHLMEVFESLLHEITRKTETMIEAIAEKQ